MPRIQRSAHYISAMLTDVHRNILALLVAGQELKTVTKHRKTEAFIGPMSIPPEQVEDLMKAGLIKKAPVHQDYGPQHGKTVWYLLTSAAS